MRLYLPEDAVASATIFANLGIEFSGRTAKYSHIPFQLAAQGAEARISRTIPATLTDFKIAPLSFLAMPVKNEIPVRVGMTSRKMT